MLDGLETLVCLHREGTMARAATALRVSPSAVSKRLAALEDELGYELLEPRGRGVRLTRDGVRLVTRVSPLLGSLRAAVADAPDESGGVLRVGVSESVLASWGAAALAAARKAVPGLDLTLHAHRSPLVLDRVRAGEVDLGVVAGRPEGIAGLAVRPWVDEEIVLVPSGLAPVRFSRRQALPVMTIEAHAATWRSLRTALARLRRDGGWRIDVTGRLESFTGLTQWARAGGGHALVPRGVALALGVSERALRSLPDPGAWRPVSIVGRPPVLDRPLVQRFLGALTATS